MEEGLVIAVSGMGGSQASSESYTRFVGGKLLKGGFSTRVIAKSLGIIPNAVRTNKTNDNRQRLTDR